MSIYKDNVVINLREYYEDKMTGEVKPGNKGISLTVDQWKRLHEQADEIDGAVRLSSDKDKIFRLGKSFLSFSRSLLTPSFTLVHSSLSIRHH